MEDQVLIKWTAMDRPHKEWSKDLYSTVIVLAFLISVILFFIEGVMPVILVWATVFMTWSMNRLPVGEASYELTTFGLKTKERVYRWEEMNSFWFEDKWGVPVMRMLLNTMPWQLIVVVNREEEEKVKKIMAKYVVYEVPKQTTGDRLTKWLANKMPLE